MQSVNGYWLAFNVAFHWP